MSFAAGRRRALLVRGQLKSVLPSPGKAPAGGERRMQNIRRIRQKGDTKRQIAMPVTASGHWQPLRRGEGMAEQEEKGPLEKLIDWLSGWKVSVERIRQRFGMPVAVLLALSVAGGLAWWNWDEIAKRPGVASILARFNQRAIPTASAGRLTMAVAHLDNDKDREHEKLLLDELRQFEGVEVVSVDRIVDPEQPDKKKAEEEARGLLGQTGTDVLVWGSVISLSGKSAMRLYWTPARDTPGAKSTGKYQPQTETIALPAEFWNDLKQILGLLVQSRIAVLTVDQFGHYVADELAPLIVQVRALVESKEGVWDPETLAGVQFSLVDRL
jgi:hypothetical protein